VDYLLDAVGKRELFSLLRMEPEKFWHTLLFRDRYNHLGILARIPPELQDTLTQRPGTLTQVRAPSPPRPSPLPLMQGVAITLSVHTNNASICKRFPPELQDTLTQHLSLPENFYAVLPTMPVTDMQSIRINPSKHNNNRCHPDACHPSCRTHSRSAGTSCRFARFAQPFSLHVLQAILAMMTVMRCRSVTHRTCIRS
jgi:hypothetical protein